MNEHMKVGQSSLVCARDGVWLQLSGWHNVSRVSGLVRMKEPAIFLQGLREA